MYSIYKHLCNVVVVGVALVPGCSLLSYHIISVVMKGGAMEQNFPNGFERGPGSMNSASSLPL